jgi:outer membrane protein TolC
MLLRFFTPLLFASLLLSSASGVTLSPEAAAEYALRHNADLDAARIAIGEARGRLQHSGRLSNPELELEFSKNPRSRESSASVVLFQRLPLTGRLRHEKAVSRAQLAAAESEVRDAERKLSAEVRSLAIKLVALQEQHALRSTQLANIRELTDFLKKLATTGEGSSADVLQIEIESRQIEIEMLQLSAEETALLGECRILLGLPTRESLAISGKLTPPDRVRRSSDPAQRPDLIAAKSRLEAAQANVREQQARRMEDIGVGISFTNERTIDDPNPIQKEQIIGLRFSLPLPLWNDNLGRIHEATNASARAEKELAAARVSLETEILAARNAMEAHSKILTELDSKALPQAAQLEDHLRSGYSSGHTPLVEVLRVRSRRLDLERQRLDALRDYNLAAIRHSSAAHQLPAKP